MQSPDYKKRFVAEYWQLKIRYERLIGILYKWDNSELDFKPTCPRKLYNEQVAGMKKYLDVLEKRALLEDVDLENKTNFNYKNIVMKTLTKWIEKDFSLENWIDSKEDLKASIEKAYNLPVDLRKADFRGIVRYCKEFWYECKKNRK
jgi:hypothetical protein